MVVLEKFVERQVAYRDFYQSEAEAQERMKEDFTEELLRSKYSDELVNEDRKAIEKYDLFSGDYGISKVDAFIDDGSGGNNIDWYIVGIPE